MFFPSTSSRSRLSWLPWCWSGLFSSCDPSMAASCGFSCSGPRMGPAPCPCPCHLTGVRFSPRSVHPFALDLSIYNSDVDPGLVRWWGLARHGHDPCPGGRPARHRGGEVACLFCPSTFGDLTHCLTSCPAFEDVRVQWCIAVRIAPAEVSTSAQHSWVFDPTHPANTRSTARAHVRFVGQVCARVFERSTLPS